MDLDGSIRERLDGLSSHMSQYTKADASPPELLEIRDIILEIERLLTDKSSQHEPGGYPNHPLGLTPHLTSGILFRLDRCEELLKYVELCRERAYEAIPEIDTLLYPSIGDTILRRIFAFLLHFRARVSKYAADYDQPTLREILYLKSPSRLEPFLRRLLPKKRSGWSYFPKEESSSAA